MELYDMFLVLHKIVDRNYYWFLIFEKMIFVGYGFIQKDIFF